MTDLRVHTCKMNSYSSFHPTINLSVDFSHSLSLERTGPHLMRMRASIRRSLNYSGSLEIVRMWKG
jgi:hypothetical protein